MKLLLIGSASVHTFRYLAGIAPQVSEVHLVTSGPLPERYHAANLGRVLQVDFSLRALRTASRIAALIDELRPDIVHVHQANSVAWHARRALAGRRMPWLLTAWGSDVLLLPQQSRLLRSMVAANLAAASAVTSDSLHMAAVCRQLAPLRRMDVLNFGMDELPAQPDIAAKPLSVLSCRLHKPLYRIDAIVRAWAEVEADARFAGWSLTVAASGSETDALLQLARKLQLQRIHFTGFVTPDVLAGLYRDARLFVSVPTSDATSISLLEAMGHGCLPLLSNLPANLEWVLDGVNGAIVEDVARLGTALKAQLLRAGDNEQLAEAVALNRRLVSEKGLHQHNMARFADIYRQLLAH
ncbi:glycosyltransferase family 4 protein [Vogesella sp. LIG4]|uniref:glycosyltransferase family 4 protein n=1 Tax=Vogesella sp. LIG4 TaxID=1192162 RepID=UPI00081FC138|nr:glycosyltransferase family 4 protein [Vogesella sp. LIG4]SCK09836.1 Glycosyltransferase involved in cell wall bisynthesis [Vogesella sp. LIG4]